MRIRPLLALVVPVILAVGGLGFLLFRPADDPGPAYGESPRSDEPGRRPGEAPEADGRAREIPDPPVEPAEEGPGNDADADGTAPAASETGGTGSDGTESELTREIRAILADYQALIAGDPDMFGGMPTNEALHARIEALLDRLRALGPEAIDALLDLVRETSETTDRAFLLRGMAAIGGAEALEGFRELLSEVPGDYRTKFQIVHQMGDPADPEVRDVLLDALRDEPDYRIRIQLIRALSEGPSEQVAPAIAEIASGQGNLNTRLEAVGALGELNDPATVPDLERLVRGDRELYVRQRAIDAYWQVAGEDAVPLLEELVQDESNERILASSVMALGHVGGPEARRILERLEEYHASEAVRLRAHDALQMMDRRESGETEDGDLHVEPGQRPVPRMGDRNGNE